jgi:pantetheine-phosphate adenylyltransferase
MNGPSSRLAVYTGSFDPITLGHVNVIERSARLVDLLIVGIGENVEKPSLFSPSERLQLAKEATGHILNVDVRTFSGLAVSFVRECGAHVMVRGVRPLTDIAAEFTMMLANRELDPGIETVFLMADQRLAHVSSSLIKQITPLADDERLSGFVPRQIIPYLRERLGPQGAPERSLPRKASETQ